VRARSGPRLILGRISIEGGSSETHREARRLGPFWVQSQTQKIKVRLGWGYDYAIVYTPLENTLVRIKPQTGPTNVLNLEREEELKELIVLEPGRRFEATYWIAPTGF
jgi:hypothetical protein